MVDTPDYRSRTIRFIDSQQRYAYLPIYPTNSTDFQQHLLHVNLTLDELGTRQVQQRYYEIDDRSSARLIDTYDTTDLHSLTMNDAMELAQRFQMDLSTLLFNANRIRAYCSYFFHLYDRYRFKFHRQPDQVQVFGLEHSNMERHLSSRQMSIIVEFFLQMDVDVFFLKTCSFRGAEPRSTIEGIFCREHGPMSRYSWTFCGQPTCTCCRPMNVDQRQTTWPVIDQQQLSTHQFINGYMTYLNCPATCTTKNMIYVMTCPCREYDYVAATDRCLRDVIDEHRSNCLRVIHRALTGSLLNGNWWLSNYDNHESNRLNRMRLYQHVARCPIALTSFLQCNPHYWCFIPRHWNEGMHSFTDALGEPIEQESELDNLLGRGIIDDQRIISYLERVPMPPMDFAFSFQDRQQQRFFFKRMFSTAGFGHLPFRPLDLYTYSIVAVLPEYTRPSTRYILETLFAVHGECKLNMICPCGGDPKQTYGTPYRRLWFVGLQRPATLTNNSIGSTSDLFTCL